MSELKIASESSVSESSVVLLQVVLESYKLPQANISTHYISPLWWYILNISSQRQWDNERLLITRARFTFKVKPEHILLGAPAASSHSSPAGKLYVFWHISTSENLYSTVRTKLHLQSRYSCRCMMKKEQQKKENRKDKKGREETEFKIKQGKK